MATTELRPYRYGSEIVEAARITEASFERPPSDHHIIGVTYDPVGRCAYVDTIDGQARAVIGQWVVRGQDGWRVVGDEFEQAAEQIEGGHDGE